MKEQWTEQDEKNLCDLVCLCNMWQEGNKVTLLPHRAYEMRNWLQSKFPNADRYSRPRVPIELLSWDDFMDIKNESFND